MPYIVIEGGEATGKGTLVKMLKERFPDAVFVAEPGTTDIAKEIRKEIMEHPEYSEFKKVELFSKARADLMKEIVFPALKEGKLVISDRSWISSCIYQSTDGTVSSIENGIVGEPAITKSHIIKTNMENNAFIYPDGIIWLNLSPEIALKRIVGYDRETNYFDNLPLEYHKKIQRKYKEMLYTMNLCQSNLLLEIKDTLDISSCFDDIKNWIDNK